MSIANNQERTGVVAQKSRPIEKENTRSLQILVDEISPRRSTGYIVHSVDGMLQANGGSAGAAGITPSRRADGTISGGESDC
jgi:hypothetical protein